MAWDFLLLVRDVYKSDDQWGRLWVRSADGARWELFSYSYELPWSEDSAGRSKKNVSRIKLGTYELTARSDGNKGWRLQLEGTGHRTYVQIHRAHRSMFIEGCILPVNFNDFSEAGLRRGDRKIETDSIALMGKLEARHAALLARQQARAARGGGRAGRASLQIAAQLPPMLSIEERVSVAV